MNGWRVGGGGEGEEQGPACLSTRLFHQEPECFLYFLLSLHSHISKGQLSSIYLIPLKKHCSSRLQFPGLHVFKLLPCSQCRERPSPRTVLHTLAFIIKFSRFESLSVLPLRFLLFLMLASPVLHTHKLAGAAAQVWSDFVFIAPLIGNFKVVVFSASA